MNVFEWLRRAWYWVRREQLTRDLEEEMRIHVELRAESINKSHHHDDAQYRARRRFGNTTEIQDRSRDMWGFGSFEAFTKDVKFAIRRLTKRPAFALSVIAVMAIGIGAVTAMFSAVDAALLRPLPFRAPEELMAVNGFRVPHSSSFRREGGPTPMLTVLDLREMKHLVSDVATYAVGAFNLADENRPIRIVTGVVTPNFFRTLGVTPFMGRDFADGEDKAASPDVAIISHALWQRQYGGRNIEGLRLKLGARMFEVVGVMPRGFAFPDESDVWVPMSIPTDDRTFEAFRNYIPSVSIARLAPGVTTEAGKAQALARFNQWFATLDAHNRENYAEDIAELRKSGVFVPLHDRLVGDRATALFVLLGATVLLLGIACVNVTNLMLAQSSSRQRELVLRGVLGATRGRLVRQLLTESIILAGGGAVLGIALAPVALRVMNVLMPKSLAGVVVADLNLRVLAFAAVAAILTGLAFGTGPAFRSTSGNDNEVLKSSGLGTTLGRAGRARKILVGAELALTVMLLVGAGLMLRTFGEVMSRDSGLAIENVGTLEMTMPGGRGTVGARTQKLKDILTRLENTPGIQAAGAINDLPLRGIGGISLSLETDGPPLPKSKEPVYVRMAQASPGYFRAVGMQLLRGTTFRETADSGAPSVVVVSKLMADHYWPGMDPIGHTITLAEMKMTVIGVVSDVRENRLEDEARPQFYMPLFSGTPLSFAVVARGSLTPATLLGSMSESVRAVDRSQAVYNLKSFRDVLDSSVAARRTNALLIGTFAGLALLLASVGVYAVVSYGVAERTRELGIRAALGASGSELMSMISREMVVVAGIGLTVGIAGAWALAKTLESMVYGVGIHDPLTFSVVPIALLIPVALATTLPARRAMRVDPAQVMRAE